MMDLDWLRNERADGRAMGSKDLVRQSDFRVVTVHIPFSVIHVMTII